MEAQEDKNFEAAELLELAVPQQPMSVEEQQVVVGLLVGRENRQRPTFDLIVAVELEDVGAPVEAGVH